MTICEDCHELEKEQFDLAIKILKLAFQKRGLLSDKILEIGRALENWDIKNNNEPRISALCFALENPEIMDFVEERMFESFRGGLKCQ